MIKAAFMFIAAGGDPSKHDVKLEAGDVELRVVGVKSYAEAEEQARKLAHAGVGAIELCAGFGHAGVARVAQAAGPGVHVGIVRFDLHPGLGNKSGDEFFA